MTEKPSFTLAVCLAICFCLQFPTACHCHSGPPTLRDHLRKISMHGNEQLHPGGYQRHMRNDGSTQRRSQSANELVTLEGRNKQSIAS